MQQNVAKRPYNHCRYAGNNGDVWKHLILVEVLRHLAVMRPHSFHYVETHAGPGYARLGENGDWRRGIGKFMESSMPQDLSHPYFDLVLPSMHENFLYKGSWVLATELLRNLVHPNFKVTVHEVNADTLKMAGSAIRKGQLSNWVKLEPKNGYDALNRLESSDFVLIDPPYRSSDGSADDWDRVTQALDRVMKLNTRWMIWYPLFRRQEPDTLIDRSCGTSFEFEWASDAPGWVMKGCGMLADPHTAEFLLSNDAMLNRLAHHLGGGLIVRPSASKTQGPHEVRPSSDNISRYAFQA